MRPHARPVYVLLLRQTRSTPRGVAHVIHDLEYNPRTQYRVHIAAAWVWLASALPILVLFFGFPDQWLKWGVLVTLLYSLYANFSTDYGSASAALAAMGSMGMTLEGRDDASDLELPQR